MGVVNAVYSASTGGNGYRLRSEVAGKQQEKDLVRNGRSLQIMEYLYRYHYLLCQCC